MTKSKWRLERKESFSHKLTKERTYRKFNRFEKGGILGIVLILGILTMSYGYYINVVAPFLPGSQHNDPFTQIWNGSITGLGSVATTFNIAKTQSSAPTNNPNFQTGPDNTITTYRMDEAFCTGALSSFTLSKIDMTLKRVGNPTGNIQFFVWSGGLQNVNGNCADNNLGQTNFGSSIALSAIPTTYTTITVTGSYGITSTGSNSFAVGVRVTCNGTCDTNNYITAGITNAGGTTNENAWINMPTFVPGNCAQPVGTPDACPTAYKYQYTLYSSNFCPSGYTCQLSYGDNSNLLTLTANSTFPGIAISKSPIDFSSAASKELFWFETWNNASNYVAQPIGWFLTTNQTLPTQVNYTPLNDSSVVMLNILYPLSGGKNIYYNYQSKTAGQSLFNASGVSINPYPTCPQSSTLFICAQANINSGGFRDFSMTMNYTGTAGSGGPNGASLTCNESTPGPGPNTYDFCLAAYTPTPCTGTNAVACSTRVFPYLNVNAGPYYIGYWTAPGQTGKIQFGTSNSGAFDRRANMAFVWVPNPCGGTAVNCTQSTTDSGGFFGWLGHTIGGAFNVVGNTLGQALGPILSFGGSLLGALYSGFVQAVGILIQTYRVVLNFLGNLVGLGNLGDLLLSLLAIVATLITQGLSTIVSFFTTVGNFLTSGLLGFLAGALGVIPTLINLAIIVWNFVFNSNFSVKTILYVDGLICGFAWYKKGLKGFFAWVSLNIFIFTFVFNAAWTVFDIITRPIHRTKETVDPVG